MNFFFVSENWEIKYGDEFTMCGNASGAGYVWETLQYESWMIRNWTDIFQLLFLFMLCIFQRSQRYFKFCPNLILTHNVIIFHIIYIVYTDFISMIGSRINCIWISKLRLKISLIVQLFKDGYSNAWHA